MESLLNKIYFNLDSPACYSSPKNVLKEAKKHNNKITLEDVSKFLEKQATYTRFRHVTRKFKRLKTIPSGLNTDWQADLAVFQNISQYNDDHNYLLVVIDVLSRKIYVEPIKQKTSTYMIPAFERIFKRAKAKPWSLYTDEGLEFESKAMKSFLNKHEIQKYVATTHPVLHATVAERAIRTIKDRLYKYFNEKNTLKWVDVIQDIIEAINNSVNSSIGVRPNEVTYENADKLFNQVFKESLDYYKKSKFKKGDYVRIALKKSTFSKGTANFSAEIYKIHQVFSHKIPVVYKIENLDGKVLKGYFYDQELVKSDKKSNWVIENVVKTRNKGFITEYFVKYKGFPSEYNRWIREKDLL